MKRILCALVAMLLCGALAPVALAAPIDPQRPSSLEICCQFEGEAYQGLTCRIYRVAEVSAEGEYTLTGAFADYPVSLYQVTSQAQWRTIASTLAAYAAADGILADGEAVTDGNGSAMFADLLPGMYLIRPDSAEAEGKTVIFETFLTAVPYPTEDGYHDYDLTVYPKAETHIPQPDPVEYKVVKQWQDEGNVDSRPNSVTVDIYKDGKLEFSQVLSAENNWCYRWTAPDDGSDWQAVERAIPGVYRMTVVKEGSTIVITNIYETPPQPPETGETMVLWPWILTVCLCGCGCLLLAAWRMRYGK